MPEKYGNVMPKKMIIPIVYMMSKMHTSKVETIIMISYIIGKIYFLRHKIAIHFWYYHLSRHVPNFLNF